MTSTTSPRTSVATHVIECQPIRPAKLFYGDFAGDGKPLAIEAKYDEQGRLVPARNKPEVEKALPLVEAAFPTYHEFASATLADIVGEKPLAEALELTANTVDSVVLAQRWPGTLHGRAAAGAGAGRRRGSAS